MAYIGKQPAVAALTASDITDGIISEAKMANDAISLAELKAGTDGNVISYDASGNPVAIATGTAGHFLKSAGAGSQPVFAVSPGKAGQILQFENSYSQSTTGTSMVDLEQSSGVDWEPAITPSATSSTILMCASLNIYNAQNSSNSQQENRYTLHCDYQIGAGSYTDFLNQDYLGHYYYNGSQQTDMNQSTYVVNYRILSPSTTSAVKFKWQYALHSSGGIVQWHGNDKRSSVTLMEILA